MTYCSYRYLDVRLCGVEVAYAAEEGDDQQQGRIAPAGHHPASHQPAHGSTDNSLRVYRSRLHKMYTAKATSFTHVCSVFECQLSAMLTADAEVEYE